MHGDQAWRGQRVWEGEPAWQRPWGLAVAMVRSWRAGGLRAENPPCRAVRGFPACGVGSRPSGRLCSWSCSRDMLGVREGHPAPPS